MRFLKSLWRKWFKRKTGSFDTLAIETWHRNADGSKTSTWEFRPAYDPELDPEKLLRGEVESYFE